MDWIFLVYPKVLIFITFCDLVLWCNTKVFFVVCKTKPVWYCFTFSLLAFLIQGNTSVCNSRLTSFCLTGIILSCAKKIGSGIFLFQLQLQNSNTCMPVEDSSTHSPCLHPPCLIFKRKIDKYPKYFYQEFNERISLRSPIPSLFHADYTLLSVEHRLFRFGVWWGEGMNGRSSLLTSEPGVLTGTALCPAYSDPHAASGLFGAWGQTAGFWLRVPWGHKVLLRNFNS